MPPRTDPRGVVSLVGKIRCVLVHDHVLLRQGLRRLLQDEPDIEMLSEAGNAAECLRKVYEMQPDVVIADAGTFGVSATEVETLLSRESSHTKVVLLSMREQPSHALGGADVGPETCAARQTSAKELVQMVRNAYRGQASYKDTAPLRSVPRSAESLFSPRLTLTAREREVLKLLAEGKTVRAAATVLGLSS